MKLCINLFKKVTILQQNNYFSFVGPANWKCAWKDVMYYEKTIFCELIEMGYSRNW